MKITTTCEWNWSVCVNHRYMIIRQHFFVSGELETFIELTYFLSFNSHRKFQSDSAGSLFQWKIIFCQSIVTGNFNQILQGAFFSEKYILSLNSHRKFNQILQGAFFSIKSSVYASTVRKKDIFHAKRYQIVKICMLCGYIFLYRHVFVLLMQMKLEY